MRWLRFVYMTIPTISTPCGLPRRIFLHRRWRAAVIVANNIPDPYVRASLLFRIMKDAPQEIRTRNLPSYSSDLRISDTLHRLVPDTLNTAFVPARLCFRRGVDSLTSAGITSELPRLAGSHVPPVRQLWQMDLLKKNCTFPFILMIPPH